MQKRVIKKLDLRLVTKGKSLVTVGDRNIYTKFDLDNSSHSDILESFITLIPDISGVKYAEIVISSDEGINFGGADIYFC